MSVITLCFIMLLVERAPLSLKIELIVVCVFLHQVNYSGFQVSLWVSEWTILTVITVCKLLWKFSAKLRFVLLHVIQSLNFIMWKIARVLVRTFFWFSKLTKIWAYRVSVSSLIFNRVKELTMLMIVLIGNGALLCFESFEYQMSDTLLRCLTVDFKNLILLGFYHGIRMRWVRKLGRLRDICLIVLGWRVCQLLKGLWIVRGIV